MDGWMDDGVERRRDWPFWNDGVGGGTSCEIKGAAAMPHLEWASRVPV